jgi:hypothetical protein
VVRVGLVQGLEDAYFGHGGAAVLCDCADDLQSDHFLLLPVVALQHLAKRALTEQREDLVCTRHRHASGKERTSRGDEPSDRDDEMAIGVAQRHLLVGLRLRRNVLPVDVKLQQGGEGSNGCRLWAFDRDRSYSDFHSDPFWHAELKGRWSSAQLEI